MTHRQEAIIDKLDQKLVCNVLSLHNSGAFDAGPNP